MKGDVLIMEVPNHSGVVRVQRKSERLEIGELGTHVLSRLIPVVDPGGRVHQG
jgi:hypothetical protein